MSTTARLNLPYIAPLQAQKQVTYNEAMAALDQLVQPVVLSRTLDSPPATPAEGDCYIVGPFPDGAWTGRAGQLACLLSGAWSFRVPAEGWLAYVVDSAEVAVRRSGDWESFVTTGGVALARLGINHAADLTSRLSVAAAASLFTHDGAGHSLAIDKASAADVASLVFSDAASGRAEIGLLGDDSFHLRVSADGAAWLDALGIAPDTGLVSLPAGRLAFPAVQNPSTDANTLDDYEEGAFTPALAFGGASSGIAYGGQTGGRYTKIGRHVSFCGAVALTSKGSASGAATVSGLPFTPASDGLYTSVAIGFASGYSGITGAICATISPGLARLNLYHANNGASAGLTNTNFSNTSTLFFAGGYDT